MGNETRVGFLVSLVSFYFCMFTIWKKNVCSPKKPRKPRNELNGGWLVGNTLWFNMVSRDDLL